MCLTTVFLPILSSLECKFQEGGDFVLVTAIFLASMINVYIYINKYLQTGMIMKNRPITSYVILLHNRTFLKLKVIFYLHDL